MKSFYINLLGFNLTWYGLITFGNSFIPVALVVIALHVCFLKAHNKEYLVIVLVTLLGVFIDALLTFFGVFIFTTSSSIIPLWLIILWAAFACTINHSLKPLQHSIVQQTLVGFIFPALSYLAGNALGAVEFGYSYWFTYFLLGAIWAPLLVSFFYLNSKISNSSTLQPTQNKEHPDVESTP